MFRLEFDKLAEALAELRREGDRGARGYRFERLVKRLFEQVGYETVMNPGAARPRQTDLHARRGADEYAVEAKWHSRPADVDAIAGLRDRLEQIPTRLAGALFSMSGYTRGAITEVEARRQREILLFDAHEIEAIVHGDLNLHHALQRKRRALSRDARVLFLRDGQPDLTHLGTPDVADLPPPNARCNDANGLPLDWIVCPGEFGPLVFAKELPDVDWSALEGFRSGWIFKYRLKTRQGLHACLTSSAGRLG